MRTGITLDLDSINVTSFETSPGEGRANGALLATRHTGGACCDNTVCLTRIECSTERCA